MDATTAAMDKTALSDMLEDAIGLHQAGRRVAAEGLYRRILDINPDEPDALNLLGLILQDRGELIPSIDLITRALSIDPDFPEALVNLARAQRAAGQPGLAAVNARRAMVLDRDLTEACIILGHCMLDMGDPVAAAEAARQALTVAPDTVAALLILGTAQEGLKAYQDAAFTYRTILGLLPENLPVQVRLAAVLSELGQLDEAVRLYRRAADLAPAELPPFVGLGMALQRAEDVAGSMVALARALELAPMRADVWRMQGGNFDALGRFDEAAACYRRALEIDPTSGETRRSLAIIGRLSVDAAEIERLEHIFADEAQPERDRIAAGFALGVSFDKAGDYDKAFPAYQMANRLAKTYHSASGIVFDADHLRRDVDAQIAGFTPTALAMGRMKGHPSEQPVFVVGMPRSGTTLVEQIAASHSRVFGVGETMDIHGIVRRLERGQPGVHPIHWDATAVRRETDAHLSRLRKVAGNVDRVVDKLPDNILALGRIAMLFPQARVIFCRRDLRDVGLSCFFQQFNDPTPWSLDLYDCGVRANEIARLMTFWLSVRPLRILEVHYEALVADFEDQSRRLIDFLGLEWDPACLEFYKTERKVMSASQWQVRQPLYASSSGRWKNYSKHLSPLLQGLGPSAPTEV